MSRRYVITNPDGEVVSEKELPFDPYEDPELKRREEEKKRKAYERAMKGIYFLSIPHMHSSIIVPKDPSCA